MYMLIVYIYSSDGGKWKDGCDGITDRICGYLDRVTGGPNY